MYETGERAATNVSRTALNLRPGTGAAVPAVTGANRAPAASRTNDPNKPHTPHKPGPINPAPIHPPVPIHPAEWSKQAEREAAAARARAELNAGIRLLHRSAGAICADAMPFFGTERAMRPRTGARWRRWRSRSRRWRAGRKRVEAFPTPPGGSNDEG